MDLKINRDKGDLVFVNGSCPVTNDYTDSTAQRVYIMLRTFRTEWYLNDTTGVPYIQRILGKKVDKATVDRIIQECVLEVEGVADITSFESRIDSDRVYTVEVTIRDTTGGDFNSSLDINLI